MRALVRRAVKGALRHAVAGVGQARARLQGDRPSEDAGDAAGEGPRTDSELPRVLCYHGVCARPPDEWSVTPRQLERHMRHLAERCRPVPLSDVVAWARGEGALPPRAVAVTFDDGYRDVLTEAAPILAHHGVPATAFIAPLLLDGYAPDPSFAPTRPFLKWSQARALCQTGFTLGSHALTHPVLARLPLAEARRQLVESRRRLEEVTGLPVRHLAYPYGTRRTVSPRDQALAREAGYEAAFLDMTGPIRRGADLWALPRSKVLGVDSLAVVRASLGGRMDLWRVIEAR